MQPKFHCHSKIRTMMQQHRRAAALTTLLLLVNLVDANGLMRGRAHDDGAAAISTTHARRRSLMQAAAAAPPPTSDKGSTLKQQQRPRQPWKLEPEVTAAAAAAPAARPAGGPATDLSADDYADGPADDAPPPPDDGSDEEEQPPDPDPLPEPEGPPSAQDLDVLARANELRAAHGAPPLKWDGSLAAGAKFYSGGCPRGHSGARGLGENMAWGAKSWRAALDEWYAARRAYDWANPGWAAGAAPFTQLVWRDSQRFGCAANPKCAGGGVYICYFAPAGNVLGVDWRRHVLPKRARARRAGKPSAPAAAS